MKIKDNTIYNDDCRKMLKDIPDNSVDIVFTDPPYNVGKKYDGYNDKITSGEYRHFMKLVIDECERISRRGIIFYVSGSLTRLFFELMPYAHLIPVHKKAAGVKSNNYMLQYHSIFSTVTPLVKCRDLWDDIRLPGEGYFFREERFENPGLTSEKLVEKVLFHFTNEDDLVLDPFMGTGTSAVACKKMKRKYVGIEQSKKYCDMAEKRLSETEFSLQELYNSVNK